MWQFLVAMLVFDTWQYFWHRLMHNNAFLYRPMHSLHHRLLTSYAYAMQQNHPVKSLLLTPPATARDMLALVVSGMSPSVLAWFTML